MDPRVVEAAKLLGLTVTEAKESAIALNISLLALLGLEKAAKLLGLTVTEAKESATALNISLLVLLGLEEAPVGEIVDRYVIWGASDQA
jgi:hypothetical protein